MAIQMIRELDSGVSVTYHRVTGLSINVTASNARFVVDSYVDGSARQAGKGPADQEVFVMGPDRFTMTNAAMDARSPIALAYDFLKTLERFAGAVDC